MADLTKQTCDHLKVCIFSRVCCFFARSPDRSVTAENINDKYTEGQEVDVRVLEVNTANNKMSLSMMPATEEAGEISAPATDIILFYSVREQHLR